MVEIILGHATMLIGYLTYIIIADKNYKKSYSIFESQD